MKNNLNPKSHDRVYLKGYYGIQAEYPNTDKVRVDYWLKHAIVHDGNVFMHLPENYEASIFHHFRVLDPTQLDLENSISVLYDSQKSFPVVIFSGEGKKATRLFLPSI